MRHTNYRAPDKQASTANLLQKEEHHQDLQPDKSMSDLAGVSVSSKGGPEDLSGMGKLIQQAFGGDPEDSKADQKTNKRGRKGKDPNPFRPAVLPWKH
ncbi:serum amyloid A-2 protein-like [Hyperolius riggenbachi]|uniref:serum amyloid A-2 protein-like n=1 Tax=Hyperolius riggenbachi TaxID=752182 RepID=UPI0035A28F7C